MGQTRGAGYKRFGLQRFPFMAAQGCAHSVPPHVMPQFAQLDLETARRNDIDAHTLNRAVYQAGSAEATALAAAPFRHA
ncbi:MAG: hypothetical protein EOO62_34675 [Hymenobacter sp.]|nr:MAG: hypothetical protein EOO62_34675 [Hymenobacter sp.]